MEIVAQNTDEEIERAKQLKEMFVNLQCPRCKVTVRSALELQELTDNCTKCRR